MYLYIRILYVFLYTLSHRFDCFLKIRRLKSSVLGAQSFPAIVYIDFWMEFFFLFCFLSRIWYRQIHIYCVYAYPFTGRKKKITESHWMVTNLYLRPPKYIKRFFFCFFIPTRAERFLLGALNPYEAVIAPYQNIHLKYIYLIFFQLILHRAQLLEFTTGY